MKIPITLKIKEIKGVKRFIISYKNEKNEWVDSIFSVKKKDVRGGTYYSSLIDTDKEAWKPQKKEENVNPEEFFDDIAEKEAKQEELISDDDLPF